MAWTTPRTWVTGEVVTAALLNAQIKANMDLSAPAKLTTAGDMLYSDGANSPVRLAKGSNGNILHQASCAPAWTASPSITGITLSGALDANGTVDADVTDFDVLSSGDIDLVSSANAAAAVYIAQSTGTSGTIKIHADTGTSVTEGAESVNILSDVGGVGIRSTANLANAVNITADGGSTSTIQIFNDQGTSVTEGAASIAILSDAGGVELRSTANLANAINITNDGGTTGTISIFNDQGSSVTEGAESISLLSDAGGVGIRSTANLANAVNITADGGTTSTIQIYNDQGTAVNEGVASIQVLSDVGGIGIKSGLNAAGAIRLTADAGTSETIILHADQGSGVASISLLSDAGGITLNPATFVTIGGNATNAGEVRILEDTDNGCNYVALKAPNVSTSYTITLPTAVAGTCGFVLTSTTAGVTSWAAASGGPTQAIEAELECSSNVDKYAPPDLIKHSPGVAKAFVRFYNTTIKDSYNVACICDVGTGDWKVNFTVSFAAADNYAGVGMTKTGDSTTTGAITVGGLNDAWAADEARLAGWDECGTSRDPSGSGTPGIMAAFYGLQ